MNTDLALIRYNLRCGSYSSAAEEASKALRQKPKHRGILLFWKACSLGSSGKRQQCIDALESMRKQYRLLDYAIISALLWYVADEAELKKLKIAIRAARDCVHIDGALLAADFYVHIAKDYEEAEKCLCLISSKMMSRSPEQSRVSQQEIYRIRLWSQVSSRESFITDDIDSVIDGLESSEDIDSIMAQAKYIELTGNTQGALGLLGAIAAGDDAFFPVFIERSKIFVSMKRYALAEESAHRSYAINSHHVESIRNLTFVLYLTNNDKSHCLELLTQLSTILQKESLSAVQSYLETAQLFSRLSNSDKDTLEITIRMVSKACDREVDNYECRIEYARQLRCLGRYDDAIAQYRFASNIETDRVEALEGVILCLVLSGAIEEAVQQIEFVELIQDNESTNAEIIFARLLASDGENPSDATNSMSKIVHFFGQSIEKQSLTRRGVFSSSPYASFDLSLVIDTAHHFISTFYFPALSEVRDEVDDVRNLSSNFCNLLQVLTERYPSNGEIHAILAKIKCELRDLDGAEASLCRYSDGSQLGIALTALVQAQIHLLTSDFNAVEQSLEQALSQDFNVLQHPLFCLLKGFLYFEMGELEASRGSLSTVLTYIKGEHRSSDMISQQDKVSCFIKMAEVLKKMKHDTELVNLISSAEKMLTKAQAFDLLQFKSDLFIESGNITGALAVYDDILRESAQYEAAQIAKAEIFLNHKNDPEKYIRCHQNLMGDNETPKAHLTLGDAYMKVNCPGKAIDAYKSALKLDPKNGALALKIGDTLKFSHEYKTAVGHYLKFLQVSPDCQIVRFELAHLYMNIARYDEALRLFDSLLPDLDETLKDPKLDRALILLNVSKVYRCKNDYEKAIDSLNHAKLLKLEKLTEKRKLGSVAIYEDEKFLAALLFDLSVCYEKQKKLDSAIDAAKESIQLITTEKNTHMHFVSLLYRAKQFDLCREHCVSLLRKYPEDEDALILLCNSCLKESKFEEALSHYADFCTKKLNSYKSMMQYILLLYRMGKVNEFNCICEQLEETQLHNMRNKGFSVCQGLCHRLKGDHAKALESFNLARYNGKWTMIAAINMIEIYLRMDDFEYWISNKPEATKDDVSLTSADMLLREIEAIGSTCTKVQVLRGYWEIMKSLGLGNFDKPNKRFADMLKTDQENIPALLGLAIVYTFSSTPSKVRNTLKKIAKLPYNFEFATEIERSYLMLAAGYIERHKFDLAQDLCKRCLFHNRSSFKAWELLGITFELKSDACNPTDLLECFEQTWSSGNHKSCTSGYRLAELYLKLNRPTEALSVVSDVIRMLPNDTNVKALFSECVSSLKQ